MPQYKFTYFNGRAKGEVIRMLFALGETAYEDERVEIPDWSTKKATLPLLFGQLPILTIDGVVYAQSVPIGRYLAEKFGYAGKTDLDKLRADMIVHYCEDFFTALQKLQILFEKDEKIKAEKSSKFEKEELNKYLCTFEKLLKENKGGDGFYVGDSITWADLAVYQHVTSFLQSHAAIDVTRHLTGYPKLTALLQRVKTNPKIAAWFSKRPDTPF